MSGHHVLVEAPKRGSSRALPAASLQVVAPILLAAGVLLTVAGLVDVGVFYWPLRFGDPEWEFGTVAQTLDAMPLPTMGLALVSVGLWARGGSAIWCRGMAIVFLLAAAALGTLSVLFLLDVPVALKALAHAAEAVRQRGGTPNPVVASGLHRGIAKAAVFAVIYVLGYATMGAMLWRRVSRTLRQATA